MFDFIVVGARCAGASVANFLGQRAFSVLLIDKYSTPGPTLSTHIIGEADIYNRLGVLEKMEQSGAPSIKRMRIDLEGNMFESDLYVASRVIGLRRELLDRYLLDAATLHPSVASMLETRVVDTLRQDGKVIGVKCLHQDGAYRDFYGSVVIGADGSRSVVARTVSAEQLIGTSENHCAVAYIYASQVEPLPVPAVEWYWHREHVILCNPIDRSMHCIALMMGQEEFTARKDRLTSIIMEKLSQVKTLAPRIRRMQIEGMPRGIGQLNSFIKQSYGEGWVLVGDAAAYLHPITGVGIDNAVCSAEYLAAELIEYKAGRKTWNEAMGEYTRKRDERIRPQYEASLITLSRRVEPLPSESAELLKMVCTFPGLVKELGHRVQDVLALLSGNKSLTEQEGVL